MQKTYMISDNTETWTVEADSANKAVESCYDGNAGRALEVYRDGEVDPVIYALIDDDGEDHASWTPREQGPIETQWTPQWVQQA